MSEKLGILMRWIDTIQASNELQLKQTITSIKNHIHTTTRTISSLKLKMNDIRREIKKEMNERENNKNGLDCVIEKILKVRCNTYPQAFHRGEMNGVCCK